MADEIPAVEGVEHRFVEANGIRIHLAEAGPADAPAVLLLHG
jgi:pimeloyl-ACP methyl ester carboxylesterase